MEKQVICPRLYPMLGLSKMESFILSGFILGGFFCFCFFKIGMVKGKDSGFQGKKLSILGSTISQDI